MAGSKIGWLGVKYDGWEYMYDEVDIKCFGFDPSVKSSLKFLRNKKFEWVSAV